MQLNLLFRDVPHPTQELWEHLEETHREAALDKLAQLMAKAARSDEEHDHE